MPADLSHLRQYRHASFLAQRELASLVGLALQNSFSEVESGAKRPGLEVAISCALALDAPIDKLFPRLTYHVTRELIVRARRLLTRLEADGTRPDAAAYLAALINRLNRQLS